LCARKLAARITIRSVLRAPHLADHARRGVPYGVPWQEHRDPWDVIPVEENVMPLLFWYPIIVWSSICSLALESTQGELRAGGSLAIDDADV
jgi:hypothetical protein